MKTIITSLAILIISSLHAQNYEWGIFGNDSKVMLFGNNVNVRSGPGTENQVVAKLPIGHEMTIISHGEDLFTVGDMEQYWYEVSFQFNEKELTGYVWGGLIAIVSINASDGALLLFGLGTKKDAEYGWPGKVRIVKNGVLTVENDWDVIGTMFGSTTQYTYTVSAELRDKVPYTGVKDMIIITYTYEACGFENGDQLYFYNGSSLIYCCRATGASEAGLFRSSSKFTFSDEPGGEKGKIIVTTDSVEIEYNEETGEEKTSESQDIWEYVWDGNTITEKKR
ncbi:MAG: SH3 domain-containing protein [Bacteroidetes bacterium]|nr:SH3 domain-containing protein [Bacteroidota bacterium]MBU1718184.1 SH3 domain-containing protein [Bacteroidota bacterium]